MTGAEEELSALWKRLGRIAESNSADPGDLLEAVGILSDVVHTFVYLEGNQCYLAPHCSGTGTTGSIAAANSTPNSWHGSAAFASTIPRADSSRQTHVSWWGASVRDTGGAPEEEPPLGEANKGFEDRAFPSHRARVSYEDRGSAPNLALRRSTLSEKAVRDFVEEYPRTAVDTCARLARDMRSVTGHVDRHMDHFSYYLRTQTAGARLFLLPLGPVLEYAVRQRGHEAGRIRVDLHVVGRAPGAGPPLTGPGGLVPGSTTRSSTRHLPVGCALCRCRPGDGGECLPTFEAIHSFLHEFGHAFNHVLLRERPPGSSGMDYLPLKRLEDLSLWWEKRVYQPDLVDALGLSEAERGAEPVPESQKPEFQRSVLERSVATVNLDVNSRSSGGIRDSFNRYGAVFGVLRYVGFGARPRHLSSPMLRLNPGRGSCTCGGPTAVRRSSAVRGQVLVRTRLA